MTLPRYYLKERAFHGTLVQDEEAEVSVMHIRTHSYTHMHTIALYEPQIEASDEVKTPLPLIRSPPSSSKSLRRAVSGSSF